MDPDVMLKAIQDLLPFVPFSREAREEANDSLDDLRRWLFNGGFEPLWGACPEADHVVRSGGYFLVG